MGLMKQHIVNVTNVDTDSTLNLEVQVDCVVTGERLKVLVNDQDFIDWDQGKLAQDAFHYLSPTERDIIITGAGPTGYRTIFPS